MIKKELSLAILVTIVALALAHNSSFYQIIDDAETQKKVAALLMTLVSILGAFLGFVIAAVSIIASVLTFSIFQRLHDSNKTEELISKFMWLIWITAGALIVSVAAVFYFPEHKKITLMIVSFSISFWAAIFFTSMRLFELILKKGFASKTKAKSPQ